jgi:hypothetical protein
MKNKPDTIDVAFSTFVDQPPPPPKLSPRMIWMRGVALERQRAARRSLRVTRLLTAATFLLVVIAGAVFASSSASTTVADQAVAATCSILILGYTALQLIRSPR